MTGCDPWAVACPSCKVGAGEACRVSSDGSADGVHVTRVDAVAGDPLAEVDWSLLDRVELTAAGRAVCGAI
jgi:hypothetical protein